DLIAAILAFLALAVLRTSWGPVAVWLFNIWGTGDLIYAFYNGLIGVRPPPGSMGVAFFIPTAIVPLLFLAHRMMFRMLLGSRGHASPCRLAPPASTASSTPSTKGSVNKVARGLDFEGPATHGARTDPNGRNLRCISCISMQARTCDLMKKLGSSCARQRLTM